MSESEYITNIGSKDADNVQYFNYSHVIKDDSLRMVDDILGFLFAMDEKIKFEGLTQRS